MYKSKNEELKTNYRIADEGLVESMNPKDKDFIYFWNILWINYYMLIDNNKIHVLDLNVSAT